MNAMPAYSGTGVCGDDFRVSFTQDPTELSWRQGIVAQTAAHERRHHEDVCPKILQRLIKTGYRMFAAERHKVCLQGLCVQLDR